MPNEVTWPDEDLITLFEQSGELTQDEIFEAAHHLLDGKGHDISLPLTFKLEITNEYAEERQLVSALQLLQPRRIIVRDVQHGRDIMKMARLSDLVHGEFTVEAEYLDFDLNRSFYWDTYSVWNPLATTHLKVKSWGIVWDFLKFEKLQVCELMTVCPPYGLKPILDASKHTIRELTLVWRRNHSDQDQIKLRDLLHTGLKRLDFRDGTEFHHIDDLEAVIHKCPHIMSISLLLAPCESDDPFEMLKAFYPVASRLRELKMEGLLERPCSDAPPLITATFQQGRRRDSFFTQKPCRFWLTFGSMTPLESMPPSHQGKSTQKDEHAFSVIQELHDLCQGELGPLLDPDSTHSTKLLEWIGGNAGLESLMAAFELSIALRGAEEDDQNKDYIMVAFTLRSDLTTLLTTQLTL